MTSRKRKTLLSIACVGLAAGALGVVPAIAHRSVERTPEVWEAGERLLVSDSETGDIIVLDDGVEIERLSTPRAPISLARSDDGSLAFALRGRDTDRDHVTIIDTAYDEDSGEARRPYVTQTFIGQSPGGVSNGRLPEVDGQILVAEEGIGRVQLVDPAGLEGLGGADGGQLDLIGPDHYAITTGQVESGDELVHVGYLRRGGVQVLDATTGEQIAWRGGCESLHGSTATSDGERVLFGCANGVLVTPMDPASTGQSALVPYPAEGRVASFFHGSDGVIWGSTEGAQTALHRIDASSTTPTIERVDLSKRHASRTSIRMTATPGGEYIVVLTHQGFLQVRDGFDGELLHETRVSKRYDSDFHEHVERAEAPDLVATSDQVHVSLPRSGKILTVDLASGRIANKVKVGGMPTRMVLLGGES
jgi:hypothetical protein